MLVIPIADAFLILTIGILGALISITKSPDKRVIIILILKLVIILLFAMQIAWFLNFIGIGGHICEPFYC